MLAADYVFGAAVALVVGCNLYFGPRIKPERVAMQWGSDGKPTWSAPKWVALWGMVLFMLAVRLVVWLASTYAPQSVHGAELGIMLFSVTVTAAHIFVLKMAVKPWAFGDRGMKRHAAARTATLGLFLTLPACIAIDAIATTVAALVSANAGHPGFISPAMAQPGPLTKAQSDALAAYDNALNSFKSILAQRRAQIDARQPLPNLPGQALYLARNGVMSTYKDLTDVLPSQIGRPNKLGIPPAYFDAGLEPLLDEYVKLFEVMQAPPANAQKSDTPFKDVVDLGRVIARARGLGAADAEAAGRISLGLFFAETNGNQTIGNARSNKYKGSLQSGPSEDQNGRRKWAAIKPSIASLDPGLSLRDDQEEARVGRLDHRYNHWTSVRDALMNAHADIFPQVPAIVKTLPDPIDQMKLFELIQIIPSPTKSALRSGNPMSYRVSDPVIMGYLRNNSMFAYGRADRARTSATFREILDAMWLFNAKFERALAIFDEIKRSKG